jgi:DNA-binding XRE family transcriptional regulator
MPRAKVKSYPTHFSDGKFEQFCAARGRTPEEVAQAADVTWRTVQRWMRGESLPLVETWGKLAAVFGLGEGDDFLLAYAEFLGGSGPPPADEAAQPSVPYRQVDALASDAMFHALKPLHAMLDLQLSEFKPKQRQQLLSMSRQQILFLASALESEYRNFCQLARK